MKFFSGAKLHENPFLENPFFLFAEALALVSTYHQIMAKPEGFRHTGPLRHKPGGDFINTCGLS